MPIHNRRRKNSSYINENRVVFDRNIEIKNVRDYQHVINNLWEHRGFDQIELDFSSSAVGFAESMLPICAFVRHIASEGVTFNVTLPHDAKLRHLFLNANWAHLMSPQIYRPSTKKIVRNVPAQSFSTLEEQVKVVDDLIEATLDVLEWLDRSHLSALEWSLNEIVDNTLTHSESSLGGLVQLSLHPKTKDIEFVVADSGIGIQNSLRSSVEYNGLSDDLTALQYSLREGVTRGTGQGNGLFGSSQISALSGGRFYVNSGYAYIALSRGSVSRQSNCEKSLFGTSVVCTINAAKPLLLEQSLKMAGRPFQPIDRFETKYDVEDDYVEFKLRDEARSVGSRAAGKAVRNRIAFLMSSFPNRTVVIDGSGVGVFSSSFADEAFSKLQIDFDRGLLTGRFLIRNMSAINQQLVSRSTGQRRASEDTTPE